MDHGIDLVLVEHGLDGGLVHQVDLVEGRCLASELGNPAQGLFAGVHKVIEHDDVMAGFLKGQNGV
ncbi:hypothetical protein StoSoilB13_15340 [Arthrobacter sp. StoSoilB13]|nr:hypothetical protein StoSoilB13_15340 [Arthrobacter sp. StoSoilB13]